MKLPVTPVLVCMLLFEAFQTSAALNCHTCASSVCTTTKCSAGEDRCFTAPVAVLGLELSGKGCASKAMCDEASGSGKVICCQTDLCNGSVGLKLSLLIMLVPLISFILFI